MSTQMLRASYSISAPTLKRFNAVVPPGERSRMMERLMTQALLERESDLEKMAQSFMCDADFSACRDDELLWDVTTGDGLQAPR